MSPKVHRTLSLLSCTAIVTAIGAYFSPCYCFSARLRRRRVGHHLRASFRNHPPPSSRWKSASTKAAKTQLGMASMKEARAQQQQQQQQDKKPVWDPVAQIYVGGIVPSRAAVDELLRANDGALYVFGYGSLCWDPGTDNNTLANGAVTRQLGQARGYRRCWAQKSTDHRGTPAFPGLVCTLLTDAEYARFRPLAVDANGSVMESLTEGMLYKVPPALVDETLTELDFREKGGYARDVIDVVLDDNGETVQALLYRGTPDNPAFWPRALLDLPLAAAVMIQAVGPSGPNRAYLQNLDDFLEHNAQAKVLAQFDDTFRLAAMAQQLQNTQVTFLQGAGSNQHNQLLLQHVKKSVDGTFDVSGEVHTLAEMVLCTQPDNEHHKVVDIFAGGGHSAVLFGNGRMCMFGWNGSGQLGHMVSLEATGDRNGPIAVLPPLNIAVETSALGFNHTLVIERETRRLLAFGDNAHGQVCPVLSAESVAEPTSLAGFESMRFQCVAAGLFHSAAVTEDGALTTWGCNRHGQCLVDCDGRSTPLWRPPSNARVQKVCCGQRHTVILDTDSVTWTMGDNKHGQLGSEAGAMSAKGVPQRVKGPWNDQVYKNLDVHCGWSHCVVSAERSNGYVDLFGWGRNDKGQLGTGTKIESARPTRLFEGVEKIESASCGSEFTIVVRDSELWGCGWNEHGNLALGTTTDQCTLQRANAPFRVDATALGSTTRTRVAAGGAHIVAATVAKAKVFEQ